MDKEAIISPGIRGWLIVLAVLLVGAPGNFVAHAIVIERELQSPVVYAFSDPTNLVYDARWPAFIFTETSAFDAAAAFTILVLWPLFFLKHRLFRGALIITTLLFAISLFNRVLLAAMIPTVAPEHRATIYAQTVFWLPVMLVLVVYAVRSKRVQVTFRYRLMLCPFPPFITRYKPMT